MDTSTRDSTDIENASTSASPFYKTSDTTSKISTANTLDIVRLASEIVANLASVGEDEDHSVDDDDIIEDDNEFESMTEDIVSSAEPQSNFINDLLLYRLTTSMTILHQCLGAMIENISVSGLTNAFVEIMDVIDTLASTITNVVCNGNISDTSKSDLMSVCMNLLDFSYDVVNNTAKSVDEQGIMIPLWPIHESVNHSHLVHVVISSASSLSQAFTVLSKFAGINEANIQSIAILLMKGISLPIMEIALASIESTSSICTSQHIHMPTNIIAVLTNCLVKRLTNSSSFSAEGRSSAVCSLLILDAAIMSLIDLHSGDEIEVYHVFQKMNVSSNLLTAVDKLFNGLREQGNALLGREKKKIKESIYNGREFIKYKEEFNTKLGFQ